jgi:hypothetical protein
MVINKTLPHLNCLIFLFFFFFFNFFNLFILIQLLQKYVSIVVCVSISCRDAVLVASAKAWKRLKFWEVRSTKAKTELNKWLIWGSFGTFSGLNFQLIMMLMISLNRKKWSSFYWWLGGELSYSRQCLSLETIDCNSYKSNFAFVGMGCMCHFVYYRFLTRRSIQTRHGIYYSRTIKAYLETILLEKIFGCPNQIIIQLTIFFSNFQFGQCSS